MVADLYRGDAERARGLLQALAGHPLATRRTRRSASENLGAMALNQGDAAGAVHWYERAGNRAPVWAGLALARLIQGRTDLADGLMRQALQARGARSVQRELDAVRVLLVWRQDGADAARELADRMDRPGAGPLFLALRAAARGEPLDGGVPPGLVAVVPELGEP